MKIAILGAGNIGTLVGAKLANLDSTDIFIHARGDHAASLAVNGIAVEGIENFSLNPNQYHLSISDVGINSTFDGIADVIFICSKAGDVRDLFKVAKRLCHKETKICLLYTSPRPRDQRGSRMPSSA